MTPRGKLAIYWAAGCGGCEIGILAINEKILDVTAAFDLVFCPCLVDTKARDIEAMEDGDIDVCLFNGGIRNSEQEYMAQLLRKKSKALIAFGSCAHEGCIPGLANLHSKEEILHTVYNDSDSNDNPNGTRPKTQTSVEGCTLHLPEFYDSVRTLGQTVAVDYYLPGCPPEPDRIMDAVGAIVSGALPAPGTVIGSTTTVCDDCSRNRNEKTINKFYRTWEIIPNADDCLLEQGLICSGIATRAGCGARCPTVNSPCIGCYGPADGVKDFGARMMSALASVIDADTPEDAERIISAGIPDPIGTFYRFGLAHSLLQGRARREEPASVDSANEPRAEQVAGPEGDSHATN
jgi:F420-non-reducing hydrogenase small subunit